MWRQPPPLALTVTEEGVKKRTAAIDCFEAVSSYSSSCASIQNVFGLLYLLPPWRFFFFRQAWASQPIRGCAPCAILTAWSFYNVAERFLFCVTNPRQGLVSTVLRGARTVLEPNTRLAARLDTSQCLETFPPYYRIHRPYAPYVPPLTQTSGPRPHVSLR